MVVIDMDCMVIDVADGNRYGLYGYRFGWWL